MNKLPKSGRWMVEVKKLFGVILVGFAVYFLFPLLSPTLEWIVSGGAALAVAAGLVAFDVRKEPNATRGRAKLAICGIIAAGGLYAIAAAPDERPHRAASAEEGIRWLHSIEEAKTKAPKLGKPIMLDFTAEWCTSCKEMEKTTFRDHEVIRASRDVIPVKVDLTSVAGQPGD
jgi:thiol:disulfide interchange protein DsbD